MMGALQNVVTLSSNHTKRNYAAILVILVTLPIPTLMMKLVMKWQNLKKMMLGLILANFLKDLKDLGEEEVLEEEVAGEEEEVLEEIEGIGGSLVAGHHLCVALLRV